MGDEKTGDHTRSTPSKLRARLSLAAATAALLASASTASSDPTWKPAMSRATKAEQQRNISAPSQPDWLVLKSATSSDVRLAGHSSHSSHASHASHYSGSGGHLPAPPPPPPPPPRAPAPAPLAMPVPATTPQGKNLLETLLLVTPEHTGQFRELIKNSDEVSKRLEGEDPYTLFAPTDEALARVGKAKLAELRKPENEPKLRAFLYRHLAWGSRSLSESGAPFHLKSVSGPNLDVVVASSHLAVNGATIEHRNIAARNGVLHIVDRPLVDETPAEADEAQNAAPMAGSAMTKPLETEERAGSQRPAKEQQKETLYYVNPSGQSYHKSGCKFIMKGAKAVTLEEALQLASEHRPCKTCRPPTP